MFTTQKVLEFYFRAVGNLFLLGIGGIELKLLEVQTGFAVLHEYRMGWTI